MEIRTYRKEETQKLGQTTGNHLIKAGKKEKPQVLTLYGELGSGKTTFVQGLAKAIGIPRRIVSPTFILMRRYPLTIKNFSWLYHIDLYRLETEADLADLGLPEIFADPAAIVAIEWAERLKPSLPKNRTDISFTIKNEERKILIKEIF